MNTLTMTINNPNPSARNKIDLSKQYIDSVLSVTINGLICKFNYNITKSILHVLTDVYTGDIIVIGYISISEFRDQQLEKLGI